MQLHKYQKNNNLRSRYVNTKSLIRFGTAPVFEGKKIFFHYFVQSWSRYGERFSNLFQGKFQTKKTFQMFNIHFFSFSTLKN